MTSSGSFIRIRAFVAIATTSCFPKLCAPTPPVAGDAKVPRANIRDAKLHGIQMKLRKRVPALAQRGQPPRTRLGRFESDDVLEENAGRRVGHLWQGLSQVREAGGARVADISLV